MIIIVVVIVVLIAIAIVIVIATVFVLVIICVRASLEEMSPRAARMRPRSVSRQATWAPARALLILLLIE